MSKKKTDFNTIVVESCLVIVTLGLTVLMYRTTGYKMVVLNLFFLPIVVAGFFLGRYRAGVLAFFSVLAVSTVTALNIMGFAAFTSPIVIALAITIWGAVLGLTAIMVGTLSDERTEKIVELHEAYVGVVEVLSRYLQSANPRLKARSERVAELSEQVARQLKLAPKEIDDIRVAALLHDVGSIEITARVIRKAVGSLEDGQEQIDQHTFHGTDLVHSLGSVLSGAMPLLVNQSDAAEACLAAEGELPNINSPLGARIIRACRSFDMLTEGEVERMAATDAVGEIRSTAEVDDEPILDALEDVISTRPSALDAIASEIGASVSNVQSA